MKSEKYNISTNNGIKTITGYTYSLGGFRIGFSKEYEPGKKGRCWYTTELTTGYRLDRRTNQTMDAAIEEVRAFIASGRLASVLAVVLKDFEPKDVNPGLDPYYTVWTVKPAMSA